MNVARRASITAVNRSDDGRALAFSDKPPAIYVAANASNERQITTETMKKHERTNRKWKRQDLAAMFGIPEVVPIEFVAAVLGQTPAQIRRRLTRTYHPTRFHYVVRDGKKLVYVAHLLEDEGAEHGNPPLMLRDGELLVRPSFPIEHLETMLAGRTSFDLRDVQQLTGQTRDEIVVDISARRLQGVRCFQPWRWRVFHEQFATGYAGYAG